MTATRGLSTAVLVVLVSALVSACGDNDGVPPPVAPPSAVPAGITLDTVHGQPGTRVPITARLVANGESVTGAQNEITFDPVNAPIVRKANDRPDCTVNPDIGRESTGFTFQCPDGTCTSVRAIVLSRGNTTPIPDGAVLYTCTVQLPANPAPEAAVCYPLGLTDVILGDADGRQICGTDPGGHPCGIVADGLACVERPPTPTPTGSGSPPPVTPATPPAPTSTPSATPTSTVTPIPHTPGPPGIQLGTMRVVPGQVGNDLVVATLGTGGAPVAATQNDFAFDPVNTRVVPGPNGRPHCTVNPAIDRPGTVFAFQPPGCTSTSCTAVRALVIAPLDVYLPIPDGSVLYTCEVQIAETAPFGTYPLTNTNVILSDSDGRRLCGPTSDDVPCTGNADGALIVGPPFTPTATPTP